MKICRSCKEAKFLSEYTSAGSGKLYSYCNTCHAAKNRKSRLCDRFDALQHYSGTSPPSCECCGEVFIELLTIDHIGGGGAVHRRTEHSAINLPTWLKTNNYPEGFRVLCFSCNCSYGHYGYCPHQTGTKIFEPDRVYPNSSLYCAKGHKMFGDKLRFRSERKHIINRWCTGCKEKYSETRGAQRRQLRLDKASKKD